MTITADSGREASTGLGAPRAQRRRVLWRALLLDAAVALGVLTTTFVLRFGGETFVLGPIDYHFVIPALALLWLAALALRDAYDVRVMGEGAEEYRRVLEGSFLAFALTAILAYATKQEVARGVVFASFPLGAALMCGERYLLRQWLVRRRTRGDLLHRTVLVGSAASASDLASRLSAQPHLGFRVEGLVVLDHEASVDERHRVLGHACDPESIAEVVRAAHPEVVVLTASANLTPQRIRALAWALEDGNIDIVLAPGLADVSTPRVRIQPAAGLALLHVEEPAFRGSKRFVKNSLDTLGAVVGLVLLSPVLLVSASLVGASSSGGVLFRQRRIGRHGEAFDVLKFRTMYDGANDRLGEVHGLNESDGLLFKVRDDPRVTPVGRWLRRFSLDELPQLWNVLRGDMSLVGPRPLPVREDQFVGPERRRLLVKPGMTGLGQVSGRSELTWDETVRLDLYYVDNWSPSLDVLILFRTVRAVVARNGAY
jgi:exopolysaccharide biosynthesis polyprenyl glycosylphosphotransferase